MAPGVERHRHGDGDDVVAEVEDGGEVGEPGRPPQRGPPGGREGAEEGEVGGGERRIPARRIGGSDEGAGQVEDGDGHGEREEGVDRSCRGGAAPRGGHEAKAEDHRPEPGVLRLG
jgi:hypothetical protein